jgi:leader peptidase (prepilin peptidase)/N-methyltransferase
MIPAWLRESPLMFAFIICIGFCFGSFLNVVIHRLPRRESLVTPGSHCPRCSTPIRVWENIPVLSYLLLRGRCRNCGDRIAIRYPFVELLGAACILAAVVGSTSVWVAAVRYFFLLAMVVVAFIDLDHRIIPDEISLPGIVLGLLLCPLLGVSRLEGLIGAVLGSGLLFGLAVVYKRVRGIEGMGMGDVKLAAMLGAFLGWQGVLMTILVASLAGSVIGILLIAGKRGTGRTAIPFGTFLAPVGMVILLVGPKIWSWYLSLVSWRS